MVKQGSIIMINFDPRKGHEQAGYRPALVVSNDYFNQKTNLLIVCPITNTNNSFPLHIALDSSTSTTGFVLCEHVITIDPIARMYKYVENTSQNVLERVIAVLKAEIDI